MAYVVPLIGEAWDHRRRRRRRASLVATALAILAAAVVLLAPTSGLRPSAPAGFQLPPDTATLNPSAVFAQAPYMGVHCAVANSIACDEVGLAIWLRHPAYSATASIAGAAFSLNWFGDAYRFAHLSTPRRAFTGYLHPAGIVSRLHVRPTSGSVWDGTATPSPTVWVLINYGRGRYVVTHLRVALGAGWG